MKIRAIKCLFRREQHSPIEDGLLVVSKPGTAKVRYSCLVDADGQVVNATPFMILESRRDGDYKDFIFES